jgi:2-succinyl-6-hydroxy-2,4-cyclohexadiene-1-carboxylate synthase
MDTRRVQAGQVSLEVLEAGGGGRPLLLVHGFGGAKEDFADHVDALAELGWHVVAPDNRGHGKSDKPEGTGSYSFEIFAADTVALADALGWDRFVLLGHSMGGMIAQLVAAAHPDRLEGLVLMDTSHAPPEGLDTSAVELGKAIVAEGGMAALVEAQRSRDGDLDTPAHRRVEAERPGYREFNDGKSLAASPDMWIAMIDEILFGADRLEGLTKVTAPTLVIVGEQDAPFLRPSRRMAETVAGAHLAMIPDAGHSPQFENPQAWWDAVTSVLGTL